MRLLRLTQWAKRLFYQRIIPRYEEWRKHENNRTQSNPSSFRWTAGTMVSLHHLCKKLIMIVLFVGGCLILFQELSQRASLTANHNTITWRLPDVYNGTNAQMLIGEGIYDAANRRLILNTNSSWPEHILSCWTNLFTWGVAVVLSLFDGILTLFLSQTTDAVTARWEHALYHVNVVFLTPAFLAGSAISTFLIRKSRGQNLEVRVCKKLGCEDSSMFEILEPKTESAAVELINLLTHRASHLQSRVENRMTNNMKCNSPAVETLAELKYVGHLLETALAILDQVLGHNECKKAKTQAVKIQIMVDSLISKLIVEESFDSTSMPESTAELPCFPESITEIPKCTEGASTTSSRVNDQEHWRIQLLLRFPDGTTRELSELNSESTCNDLHDYIEQVLGCTAPFRVLHQQQILPRSDVLLCSLVLCEAVTTLHLFPVGPIGGGRKRVLCETDADEDNTEYNTANKPSNSSKERPNSELRRSTRVQQSKGEKPRPAADTIILYKVGPTIPQEHVDELEALLDIFHSQPSIQLACKLAIENGNRFLTLGPVEDWGIAYTANQDIPADTPIAVYSGFLAFPGDRDHEMFMGDVGVHKALARMSVDGGPYPNSFDAGRPGRLQLVNHACRPYNNCRVREIHCERSGFIAFILISDQVIKHGQQPTFPYVEVRRFNGLQVFPQEDFWKQESTLPPPEPGLALVRCKCFMFSLSEQPPVKCPNGYARHERACTISEAVQSVAHPGNSDGTFFDRANASLPKTETLVQLGRGQATGAASTGALSRAVARTSAVNCDANRSTPNHTLLRPAVTQSVNRKRHAAGSSAARGTLDSDLQALKKSKQQCMCRFTSSGRGCALCVSPLVTGPPVDKLAPAVVERDERRANSNRAVVCVPIACDKRRLSPPPTTSPHVGTYNAPQELADGVYNVAEPIESQRLWLSSFFDKLVAFTIHNMNKYDPVNAIPRGRPDRPNERLEIDLGRSGNC